MNEQKLINLQEKIRHLKTVAPKKAVKYNGAISRLENRVELLEKYTWWDAIRFKKKEDINKVEKEFDRLDASSGKLKIINDEIQRIKSIIGDFINSIEQVSSSGLDVVSRIKSDNLDFCKKHQNDIELLISECISSFDIIDTNAKIKKVSEELVHRRESVRLLEKINKLSKDYYGAPHLTDLYALFDDVTSDVYSSDSIGSKIREIDTNIDNVSKLLEKDNPRNTENTEIELRNIKDWIRELPENEEVRNYNAEYERLKSLSDQIFNNRFSSDAPSRFDNLDRDTLILLDDIKGITKRLNEKKLNGISPLLDEMKRNFPSLDEVSSSYDNLSMQVNSAEDYRIWLKLYKKFESQFDVIIANRTAELGRILNQHISDYKHTINEINDGPCSNEITSKALLLNDKIDALEAIRRSYENKKMLSALIEIKKIAQEVDDLKERVDDERVGYKRAVQEIEDIATQLDKEIDASKISFNTVKLDVIDSILKIDASSDISYALDELKNIEDGIEKVRNDFYEKCYLETTDIIAKCEKIQKVFKRISIDFEDLYFEENETSINNLLKSREYHISLNKKINSAISTLDEERKSIIEQLSHSMNLSGVSKAERDSLARLIDRIRSWDKSQEKPEESLELLEAHIFEARMKLDRYAQEEISARRLQEKLTKQLDKIDINYDSQSFSEIRKKIKSIVDGSLYTKDNLGSANKQLKYAQSVLNNLENQARRITINEFEKKYNQLELFVKKNAKYSNHSKQYEQAIDMLRRFSENRDELPSRLDRMKLASLIMEIR